VYLVIFHLKRKLPLGEFFRTINNKPMACSLLEVYCKEQDIELLKDFYFQDDRLIDRANIILNQGFSEMVSEFLFIELFDTYNLYKGYCRTYQEAQDGRQDL
jgi:hypothetical protein